MLQLTRATATLTVPYPPQEVCARLAREKALFEKYHLTCTATEQEIKLEPGWGYNSATDSYTPNGYGTLHAVDGGSRIDVEFEPGGPGVMLLALVLLFAIGTLAVLLVQLGRGDVLPWWRYIIPPGILVVGMLTLMESLHSHKNGMMFLLAQALGVEE